MIYNDMKTTSSYSIILEFRGITMHKIQTLCENLPKQAISRTKAKRSFIIVPFQDVKHVLFACLLTSVLLSTYYLSWTRQARFSVEISRPEIYLWLLLNAKMLHKTWHWTDIQNQIFTVVQSHYLIHLKYYTERPQKYYQDIKWL